MSQIAVRTNLSYCLIGLALALAVMPQGAVAGPVKNLDIEYGELKIALDSVLIERDQLRLDLSEAQSTIATMRSRLNAGDVESEVFKRQASQMKLRIGALGLVTSGDAVSRLEQRLLSAVNDLRIVTADKKKLATELVRMADSASAYAKATSTVDPSSRLALEGAIRDAHSTLETTSKANLAEQTEPSISVDGTVICVKDELSLVVVNLGSRQGVKVGMPFKISRADKLIATVRVVDVREKICGAVVQTLSSEGNRIRFGDRFQMDAIQ